MTADNLADNASITLDATVDFNLLTASADGAIAITESNAITLTDIDTDDGSISIIANGTITATDVMSGGAAGDFVSLTSNGGDIVVGVVNSAENVILDANGSILDDSANTDVDVTAAGTISLNAGTDIRGESAEVTTTDETNRFEVAAGSDVTATATNGNIRLASPGTITL
ncbi:MAG TPA: hypothetical protein DDW52_13245, partial [Planctomycetaceae bacterium]|nr:hypothetical protein [Planctomycetaceae bacterium]